MTMIGRHFENIMGKEENDGNKHFLWHFPQCFLPIQGKITPIVPYRSRHLEIHPIWMRLKFSSLEKINLLLFHFDIQ